MKLLYDILYTQISNKPKVLVLQKFLVRDIDILSAKHKKIPLEVSEYL